MKIVPSELYRLFNRVQKDAQRKGWFYCDIFDENIDKFLTTKATHYNCVGQIIFYLGSRLYFGHKYNIRNNLFDLLTPQTSVSTFLKEHDVEFIPNSGRLELLYKGRKVLFNNSIDASTQYLKNRLGHNHFRADFYFNVIMLKDLLYRNTYAKSLSEAPEFIEMLGNFLH